MYAVAFSQRIPPVQNMATFLCFPGSRLLLTYSGNCLNDAVSGSTAPSNVPRLTSKSFRVSTSSTSGSEIKAFQSLGSTYSPTCSVGSMVASPRVIISLFSRTRSRLNGRISQYDSLCSRSAILGSECISLSTASMSARLPANIPLIPSGASSIVPNNSFC